jgi:hypothetical protein
MGGRFGMIGVLYPAPLESALPLHRFSKGDTSLFQAALECYPLKIHRTRRMLQRSHIRSGRAWMSRGSDTCFPGISSNGQLLTPESPAAEDQREHQRREREESFPVILEES